MIKGLGSMLCHKAGKELSPLAWAKEKVAGCFIETRECLDGNFGNKELYSLAD